MKKIVLICILILLITVIVLNNCNSEGFTNDESKQEISQLEIKEVIWENKLLKIDDVIQKLKKSLNECGVNDLTLEKTDFTVIDSRKKLIELLPVTKLLDKLNYDQIQCFVSKFDPENYLVISKTITTVPKILRPKNIVIVNNILYNSTPYGVVKYKIPLLSEFMGLDSLNASIECGILNDFNTYNMTTDPIFHLEGRIIQKRGNQFIDIKNNDYYEITDINNKIELLNTKIINNIQTEKTQNVQVQNKIVEENKIISEQIKLFAESKVIEKMVDVGGLIELKIENPQQLKVIDTKTFIPVVRTAAKAEEKVMPSVIIDGKIVSAETVIQEIKQEMKNKGIPISEEEIKKKLVKINAISEESIQEIKQEMISKGIPISEEAIKQEMISKGIPISEEAIKQELVKINAISEASIQVIKQEMISKGIPVSEEAIKQELVKINAISEAYIQEIKQEMINKGIPISEEAIKKELVKINTISEASIQEIKQEMISKGIPISEEAIKQELQQISEEDKINAFKLAKLKALEESKSKLSSTPIIQKSDVDVEKLTNNLVSIFEYDGIIYMAEPSTVRPSSSWAIKVNELLTKNKLSIKGVIPHFYHKNNVFNYKLIFVLSDDFYIWVNKENVSGILDIKKDWNITFNPNIPDTLPCDELKVILEQMEKANILSREKSETIIKNYRC